MSFFGIAAFIFIAVLLAITIIIIINAKNKPVDNAANSVKPNSKQALSFNALSHEDRPYLVTHWHDKNDVPSKFRGHMDEIRRANPGFEFLLMDNAYCREHLLNEEQRRAFDALVPQSFKSDMCRYAFLSKNKGVYYDIKYKPFPGGKTITEIYESGHPRGSLARESRDKHINTGFLISKVDDDPLFTRVLDDIVKTVEAREYGQDPVDVTGPMALFRSASNEDKKRVDLYFKMNGVNEIWMEDSEGKRFLECSMNYKQINNAPNYRDLWKNRKVYKDK